MCYILNAHKVKGELVMIKIKRIFRKVLIFILVTLICSMEISANHIVRATKYYAGHNCGYVTASGDRINNQKVRSGEHRWVALSHDMFKKHGFKMGDKIRVESNNLVLQGEWIVKDKMSPRLRDSIDFLFTRDMKGFTNPCKVTIYRIKN